MNSHSPVHDPRERLTLRNGSATFLIALAGLMMANLGPLIMSALEKLGYDVLQAGNILTWALFASAVLGLATARMAAGTKRRALAAVGLLVSTVSFVLAAVLPNPTAVTVFFIVGGAGIGAAISTSGSAIAALRNPNRASAVNGIVNRLIVMVVLAIIPVIGIMQASVFGALALLALVGLCLVVWLPATPEYAEPVDVTQTLSIAAPKKITVAGVAILILFPLWGTSEDAIWTLAASLGAAVEMSEQTLGFALSAASGFGAVMMFLAMILGNRMGRAVPITIALIIGGVLKIWVGLTEDATTLAWLLVLVNTLYALVFVLFIATAAGLDARGRWSGPLLGAYLVGSSFAPLIGSWIIDLVGIPVFGIIMGIVSFVTIIPIILIARVSVGAEKALVRYASERVAS